MNILINFPIEPIVQREAETMQAFLRESMESHASHFNEALFFLDNIEVIAAFVILVGIVYVIRRTDTSSLHQVRQEQIVKPQPARTRAAIMLRLKKGFVNESWREIKRGSIFIAWGLAMYLLSLLFRGFVS